jgi:phage terminase Nu1 subunit (DNA packaging protein)
MPAAAPPVQERWITAGELAAAFHVSVTTVHRWRQRGMPSKTWGMRVRRYQLSACEQWLEQQDGDGTVEGGRPAP